MQPVRLRSSNVNESGFSARRASGAARPTSTVVPPGALRRGASSIVAEWPSASKTWSTPPGTSSWTRAAAWPKAPDSRRRRGLRRLRAGAPGHRSLRAATAGRSPASREPRALQRPSCTVHGSAASPPLRAARSQHPAEHAPRECIRLPGLAIRCAAVCVTRAGVPRGQHAIRAAVAALTLCARQGSPFWIRKREHDPLREIATRGHSTPMRDAPCGKQGFTKGGGS
jgi:hypothetical protein